jgi:SAM-dependent MidA family methyltransferase
LGENGKFVWRESNADSALREAVTQVIGDAAGLPRPYRSEVCTLLAPWFSEVTRTLERGDAWFVDYGYSRAEYYAPSRREGTLRCHYRHRAHEDPLILPGLQDITAWVDFDALIAAGINAGFEPAAQIAQSRFLMAHGLDEVFSRAHAQAADEATRYRLAQEIKHLTLPGEMGETFRVVQMRRR